MRPLKLKSSLVLGLCVCVLTLCLGHFSTSSPAYPSRTLISNPSLQPLIASWNTQIFGNKGRDGRDGVAGSPGRSGQETQLRLQGQSLTVDVSGTPGTDGTDALAGEHAYGCNQGTDLTHNLQGSPGGQGGSGGNGGQGGDGGQVLIYYSQPEQLQGLTLANTGGPGGRGGRGAPGGYGCSCEETNWHINYCEWQRYRKQRNVTDASWIKDKRKHLPCTGSRRVDLQQYPPILKNNSSEWAYRWEYGGVYKTEHFQCQTGTAGQDGRNGKEGPSGQYGKVTLVPRADIPQEQVQYYAPLAELLGNKVDLVKNIWTQKSGLRGQLHPNSNVPDAYTYLQSTARLDYRIDWQASESPTVLEVSETPIGAKIQVQDGQGQLDFNLPGTLEYTLDQQGQLTVMTISGGFSPNRVRSFRVDELASQKRVGQLVLVDEGDVRSQLQNTQLKVTCLSKQSASGLQAETYQVRHSVEFRVPPMGRSSDGVRVEKNVYTLNVQPFFRAWLKPGYDIQYQVEIKQMTKSNAVYTQTQIADLPVPAQ